MHTYHNIISLENLFSAWAEFICGKKKRKDVGEFSFHLSENMISLHFDLLNRSYIHGQYESFKISDPKPRDIHKAIIRDRLLHHAIYRILYPYFEKRFIFDSYSCRNFKGTHKAMNRFLHFYRKASKNSTKTCWVLKCDIRKFFASVDHKRLFQVISRHDIDIETQDLIVKVVESFSSDKVGRGLPLGNLTSQLLVNIYMNELDQFITHTLKIKYYIRFADDFVIINKSRNYLEELIPQIAYFLREKLNLSLHPNKVFIKTFASGVDFLGWIHFPHHRVLRTTTKRRMRRNLKIKCNKSQIIQSYLGMLNHGNTYKLKQKIFSSNP